MDADIAPLQKICDLAQRYDAMLYVDEVHAVGLYGSGGSGVVAREEPTDAVDVIQGTLGKAFGQIGGYIAGSATVIDYVRSFGGGFIFTTSLPPAVLAGALASLERVRSMDVERQRLHAGAERLRQNLRRRGLEVVGDDTHIVPVLIPGAANCRHVTQMLLAEGIYLQPINAPTVKAGEERVRIAVTPNHTDAQIDVLAETLERTIRTITPSMPTRRAG